MNEALAIAEAGLIAANGLGPGFLTGVFTLSAIIGSWLLLTRDD
jgi:hypothetical protein